MITAQLRAVSPKCVNNEQSFRNRENERGDDSTNPLARSPIAAALTKVTWVRRHARQALSLLQPYPRATIKRAQVPTSSTARRTCPRPDHRCTSLMVPEYPEVSAIRSGG